MQQGFTLLELMMVVAIIGILSAVGIPAYSGYADTANISSVQNNLRSVYVQQQSFLLDNNDYYITGIACDDSAALINANLFNGTQVLFGNEFRYCILQPAPQQFEARAEEIGGGGRIFTIDHNNVTNF